MKGNLSQIAEMDFLSIHDLSFIPGMVFFFPFDVIWTMVTLFVSPHGLREILRRSWAFFKSQILKPISLSSNNPSMISFFTWGSWMNFGKSMFFSLDFSILCPVPNTSSIPNSLLAMENSQWVHWKSNLSELIFRMSISKLALLFSIAFTNNNWKFEKSFWKMNSESECPSKESEKKDNLFLYLSLDRIILPYPFNWTK